MTAPFIEQPILSNRSVVFVDRYQAARAVGYLDGLGGKPFLEDEHCVEGDCISAYRLGHRDGRNAKTLRQNL